MLSIATWTVFTPVFEASSADFSPSPTSGAWRSGEQHGDCESRTRATGAGIKRGAGGTSLYNSMKYRKFFGVATRQAPHGVPVPQADLAQAVGPVAPLARAKAGGGRGSDGSGKANESHGATAYLTQRPGDPGSNILAAFNAADANLACEASGSSSRYALRSRGSVKHGGQDSESQRLPSGSGAWAQTGENCGRRAMQGPSISVQSSSAAGLNALTSWCWILAGTGS